MDIEKKISFSEEYDNWYSYVIRSKIKGNGELKAPDVNTYARYIWENKYNF